MTDETSGDNGYQIQRQQLQKQRQEQQLQQERRPLATPGAELPAKQHQSKHNPVSEAAQDCAQLRSITLGPATQLLAMMAPVRIATEVRSVANRSQNELLIPSASLLMGDLPLRLRARNRNRL